MRSSIRYWILAGLLAANLIVGVLSLYFVRSVNQRYADLFEHGAPVIYDLRTLTREVTGVQRLARRILSPEHEMAWSGLVPEMEAARNQLDARVQEISAISIFGGTPYPAEIQAINREYSTHVSEFLQLARAGKLVDAAAFNLGELRPAHDRFQETLDGAANHVEVQGRHLRDRYAKDSRFFGGISLAFASAPLVAVSLGLLAMTIMIGLLFIVFVGSRTDRRT